MAEIVISIAAKVAELLVVPIGKHICYPIGKHICYPFKCKSNIEGLKKQVEKLTNERDRVLHSVDEAKRQGNEIEKDVAKWLNSVDEFTEGVVKTIIDDEDNAKKRCLIGLCPNLMVRYSLSKKALKTTKDVVDLLGEGKFQKVSYRQRLQNTTSFYRGGYGDFDSRKPIFNDLMETLRNADVNLIGVYGMGGVGKTTLVNRVAAQALEDKLFDVVATAKVTETPNIRDIQGQIADQLGLKFEEESLTGRAARLRDRLKKEKRVLLVLDNIWAKLDLEAVGIPLREEEEKRSSLQADQKGRNDEQRQCKILLTTRKQRACNDMNTQNDFSVETLSKEEAESLFWKIVGNLEETCDPSEFRPIGVGIVEHCAGLPLAIATIANALKKQGLFNWKDALHQLRSSNPRQIMGMEEQVYPAIKLSYDRLESPEAKSVFLLCSLFHASYNISVDDLLRYAMGLSLFQNVSTVEQGRNRLHTLINNLEASSLLLDGSTKEGVKMHDIVHDVAVSIAKEKLMFIIPNDTSLKEMLEEKKLRTDATAISLPYGHGHRCELPQRLVLPKLELLYLQEDYGNLLPISDTFFEEVKELKVLALTNFNLLSLPLSLQLLTNLQTLCLDGSTLGGIATIGALPKLEVLSLLHSDIEHLPVEIKQLTRLKLLDMRNCPRLKTITPGVISSLTRLEELYIGNSFLKWDIDGQTNASLSELKQLCRLTTLEIYIPDAHIMPQDLFFGKLERYRIFIGDNVNMWDWHDNYETSKTLKLKWSNRICLSKGIKTLLNRTEDLYLDELKGVKNILNELDEEGFPQLKHLHIQNDPEIQYIVNSVGLGTSTFFPKLESLFLQNLINLEKMCHGQLAADSFIKLRIVKVGKCDRLKHLFSFSMAKNLLKLQEIEVTNCKKLEEIVFKESNEQFQQHNRVSRIELIQLRTLKLQCLPRLTSFDFKEFTPDIGSQEIVAEDEAGGLTSLFSQNVVLPSLENLKLSSINIGCTWLDQLPAISSCCQTLTSLTLEDCSGDLKFLFSYFKVKSLVLLENLKIRNCKSIEEIINTEELREGKVIKMVFPKLIKLQLKGLPNLTQFGFGNSIEFPSLTQVSVKNCPRLKIFFSLSASADLNCQDDIETISNALFPNLNRLDLIDLQELTSFCNFVENAIELPSLARLWIKNCPKMQTFISNSTCADMSTNKVVLPALASLNLSAILIQTIWHNQLETMSSCFQNLTEITMDNCDTLKYVFSYSMVESLIQLKVLEISNCKFMEMVIINQGEKISNTLFPKLYRLDLKHLPELTSFCNFAGNSTELPSLAHLCLGGCPKLQTFVSIPPHADMSASKEEQMDSEENHHAPIQPLFDERVQLPNLEDLNIDNMKNVRKVWHHQLTSVFCKLNVFWVDGCHNLLSVFPSNTLGRLQKLELLVVSNCKSLEVIFEEIVAKEEDVEAAVFPQLTLLRLVDLPKLRIIATSRTYVSRLPMLKTLRMWGCKRLQRLTSEFQSFQESHGQPPITIDKVAFPNLETLSLEWNCNAKELMNENFSGNSCKIKDLQLLDASKEAALCLCFFLYKLPNLEKLLITDGVLEEMFICKGHGCKENFMARAPSKLNHLSLDGLNDSLNLGEENTLLCKIFQNLTTLEVSSCNELKALVSSTVTFPNLTTLEVSDSGGLINLMAISTAKSLVQLARLKIIECKMIEEILIHEGDREETPIIFRKLEYLELHCLPRLTSFYTGSYAMEFPSLQQIVVRQCPNMKFFSHGALSTPSLHKLQTKEAEEGFWEGSLNKTIQKLFKDMDRFYDIENFTVSDFPHLKEVWHKQFLGCYFSNLKSLVVDDKCCSLRYIFTPSVALGLVQLQELKLKNCAVLEAIIVIEEEKMMNTLFPNLINLTLIYLPELTSFCNFVGSAIELPSLATLCIENCPNMQTFISNFTGADTSTIKDNLHRDIQPLFDEKVRLSNLKFLQLDKMDKLRKIWHHQLTSDSFYELDSFELYNCHNVLNVFPSNMLERLQKLDELWVIKCSSLDEIFEHQASSSGKTQAITATQIRKLVLRDLPKLKHVWNIDSQCLLSFQNLLSIEVLRCDSLKSIFPASIARSLLQLEQLWIEKCCMVEEIFAKGEEVDDAVPGFPQLFDLRLAELSKLRSFYPRGHISEWPMLKRLQVWNCDKVEIYASNFLRFQVTDGESQPEMPVSQPLLLFDKVPLTNLESLGLDWKLFEKGAFHEKLPEYSCKLNFLIFGGFQRKADICVYCFLQKLPNLEKLQVCGGFFKGLFLCEGLGCEEEHVEEPSYKLSHLRLVDLFDSLHLWEENSLSSKVFQQLEILQVIRCDNLNSLVPSIVSFQNLTILEVQECNELLDLVAIQTAKSLMQLTKLIVSECKMIEKIIKHEGDEAEDRIVFKKLRNLELRCLPSLTSFYLGSYSIEFPSLQQVVVRECPNMKIFSQGALSTPRLHRLQTREEEGEGFWEGNLNTTIEHLFIENCQSSKEN